MLILKYFATVGTVLTAALLALSAYLASSEPTAPARVLRTTPEIVPVDVELAGAALLALSR